MVKVAALEAAVPGLTTVTLALPGLAVKLAGTVALNCAPPRNVVTNGAPFHCTTEPATKPEPLTVSVNAGPPAGDEVGFKLVTVGPDVVIEKLTELEDAPPGLTTTMFAVLCAAIKLAETEAVSWLPLTKFVGKVEPLHCTVDPCRKPAPFTVSVKAGPPAGTVFGFSPRILGVAPLIGRATELETAPPGLLTVTLAVPGVPIKPAETEAFNVVPLRYIVDNAEPFHSTVDPLTNPVPLTIRVNAGVPAVAEAGFKLVIASGPITAICAGWAPVSTFGHTR
jgi:hypothetical protein